VSYQYTGGNATVIVNEQAKVITGWAINRTGTPEEQVDSSFGFLSAAHADLLKDILARRNSALLERIRRANSVSRSDAEEVMSAISEEFTNNPGRLRLIPPRCASGVADSVPAGACFGSRRAGGGRHGVTSGSG
jgi:hypothetical protein